MNIISIWGHFDLWYNISFGGDSKEQGIGKTMRKEITYSDYGEKQDNTNGETACEL